ncbi:hypothetical protein GCM10009780_08540 [Actinomadura alba]
MTLEPLVTVPGPEISLPAWAGEDALSTATPIAMAVASITVPSLRVLVTPLSLRRESGCALVR